jgi:hypothetical protein
MEAGNRTSQTQGLLISLHAQTYFFNNVSAHILRTPNIFNCIIQHNHTSIFAITELQHLFDLPQETGDTHLKMCPPDLKIRIVECQDIIRVPNSNIKTSLQDTQHLPALVYYLYNDHFNFNMCIYPAIFYHFLL